MTWQSHSLDLVPGSDMWAAEEYSQLQPAVTARTYWKHHLDLFETCIDLERARPKRPIRRPDDGGLPACMKDMMENGPKEGGPNRNRVLLPIVGFFRDAGYSRQEAQHEVERWTREFYPEPAKELAERVANGRSVVDAGYRGGLRFSCRFIRANRGPGAGGKVSCVGEATCPWICDPKDQEPVQVPTVALSEATKGMYIGSRIKTQVHVAALAGHPYGLPVKGRVLCNPDPTAAICGSCPNCQAEGQLAFEIETEDAVLHLVDVTEGKRKEALRKKCGIPSRCFRHEIEIGERSNVEEVQIIPTVDYSQSYFDNQGEGQLGKQSAHVVRRAFYIGHGLESNKRYAMEGLVLEHPKDQKVCFLSDQFETLANDIDRFKMTPDLYIELSRFQVELGQSVADKLHAIHTDLMHNVTHIAGRQDLAVAADLCFHSVIGFRLFGDPVPKGWFELLVMGDSACGKSTLITRLIQHYGVGELIGGEEAKRSSLVQASVQIQNRWTVQWGKIPANDRRLLVIDEFGAIPTDEVGKMTQLRSEGIARGGGVNANFETFARTRLILLTNPRNNGGKLAGFNYGVQAIQALFHEAQDLRRVDLALVLEEGEVDRRMLNTRWDRTKVEHKYTSDLCRNLVLWAWSREPGQIEFLPGVEQLLLDKAQELGAEYACDVPLATAADLKLKLARVAAATAARVFSTRDGEKLLVKPEHVEYAARVFDEAYKKEAMSYWHYAQKYQKDNYMSETRRQVISDTIESFSDPSDIVTSLLEVDKITKPNLSDMVNLEKDEFAKLWKFLVARRLINKGDRYYRKTPAFTSFLKGLAMTMRRSSDEVTPPAKHWTEEEDGDSPPF
jgi:hypothetical protein